MVSYSEKRGKKVISMLLLLIKIYEKKKLFLHHYLSFLVHVPYPSTLAEVHSFGVVPHNFYVMAVSVFQFSYNTQFYFQTTFSLTTFAGTPATIAFAGTSFVTIAPAAIIAPSPIVTPLRIVAPCPTQTCFPILMGSDTL